MICNVSCRSDLAKSVRQRLNIYVNRESDRFIVVKIPVNKIESKSTKNGGIGGAKGSNNKK